MVTLHTYDGKIPASGKSLFRFGTEQYHHRSVAKENIIVHVATRVKVLALPKGYERTKALEAMAKHIDRLNSFIKAPRSYNIISPDSLVVEDKLVASEQSIGISMNHYSDGSCTIPRHTDIGKKCGVSQQTVEKTIRRFIDGQNTNS